MSPKSSLELLRWMKPISEASGRINGKSFEIPELNGEEELKNNQFLGSYVEMAQSGPRL
jgi:hypothetical protein